MIDPPMTLVYIEGQENEPLPDYKPKHTPDVIREIRESLGESQTEFGARFGYTQAHMSNLEKGVSAKYNFKKEGNGVYVFVLKGYVTDNVQKLNTIDGLGITGEKKVNIKVDSNAEILLIEVQMN